MEDRDKTKEQLISELGKLRKQVSELKDFEAQHKWVEKALRSSEKQFRSLVQSASDAIITVDSHGKIISWNRAAEVIFGYTPDEIIGKQLSFLVPERCKGNNKREFNQITSIGKSNYIGNIVQYPGLRKDGTEFPAEISYASWETGEGKFITAIVRDITERRRAEERLRSTKEYLDNVIESSLDSIIISDRKGYITRANKAFLKLLDCEEEETIGKHMAVFSPTEVGVYESTTGKMVEIDKEFFDDAMKKISRLIEEGKITNWETYLIRSDKQVVPVEENVDYLYNEKGDINGALGIIRDITERRKAEEEKARIDTRLKNKVTELSIMNKISEVLLSTRELNELLHMILIGGTANKALGFNRAFLFLINEKENILEGKVATGAVGSEEAYIIWERLAHERHSLKELIKSRHGKLSREDEPINNLVKQMRIPLGGKESIFTQAVYEKRSFNIINGKQNPLIDQDFISLLGTDAFTLVPLISKGKPLGVLLADNFINKKYISDEDVECLRAFANHASLAIENSNLYKSLEGKIEELSDAYKDLRENRDKLIRYERLSAMGKVAAQITHEIRNPLVSIGGFARRILKKDQDGCVSRNYVKIIVEEIDHLENILSEFLYFANPAVPQYDNVDLNSIVENAIEVLSAEIEKSEISIEKHLDFNLPMHWLDENQIKQVLINLIRNAIQAMPDGGTISISTINEDQWVSVEIADTGVGISDDDVDKLFDAFFTSKSTGSGLGLTISAQIIDNHGGTIEVQRRTPVGTIFTIKLPLKAPAESS
jgi:PAS domain S-box-containing protein